MATGPKIATTPLELLSGCPEETPLLNKYFSPVAWGTIGFVSVILANFATRRPILSGIQKHIGVALGLGTIGKIASDYRDSYLADRDAVLRDYVTLHPEDFPPFERKQFKDILEPWIPIR